MLALYLHPARALESHDLLQTYNAEHSRLAWPDNALQLAVLLCGTINKKQGWIGGAWP